MDRKPESNIKRRHCILLITAALLLALVIGVVLYVSTYYRADETALAALEGSETVAVESRDGLTLFLPREPVAGFIFYPGGKVESTAYAPLMLRLAQENILCVIVKMPCNLAVLNVDAAAGIPAQFPQVDRWYLGGHSLGGSMAASFLADHREDFAGLILLAAYSTEAISDGNVLSVYGDRDGVMNREKYAKYKENLPENTTEVVIPGGNHAFFGSYGHQKKDGHATITAQQQVEATVEAILQWMAASGDSL